MKNRFRVSNKYAEINGIESNYNGSGNLIKRSGRTFYRLPAFRCVLCLFLLPSILKL